MSKSAGPTHASHGKMKYAAIAMTMPVAMKEYCFMHHMIIEIDDVTKLVEPRGTPFDSVYPEIIEGLRVNLSSSEIIIQIRLMFVMAGHSECSSSAQERHYPTSLKSFLKHRPDRPCRPLSSNLLSLLPFRSVLFPDLFYRDFLEFCVDAIDRFL